MILGMRKSRQVRGAAAGKDVRRRHEAAKGEEASRRQAAESEAALAAAAAEKELHPWPAKVGPFDHTPKRPSDGQPINYWKVSGSRKLGKHLGGVCKYLPSRSFAFDPH